MASSALENLSAASTVAGTDLIPIKQAGATLLKGTVNQLATGILSGDAVASGGTANGILYLNGSKVASSGSALTWDGNRVLNVAPASSANSIQFVFNHGGGTTYFATDSSTGANFGAAYAGVFWNSGNYPWLWAINGGEKMRLTSTGLGIGMTAPPLKLSILSGVTTSDASTPVVMLGSDRNDRYASINSLRGSASSFIGLTLSTSNNAAPAEVAWLMPNGDLMHKVNADIYALPTNGTMMFQLVSDTSLKVLVRGSDGTTRSASLTLA